MLSFHLKNVAMEIQNVVSTGGTLSSNLDLGSTVGGGSIAISIVDHMGVTLVSAVSCYCSLYIHISVRQCIHIRLDV